ncbi:MAG TPA: nickel transporter permease [Candidatus Heimdallarchaeota archaeon]|nr:nickel transporter permease [Candidatus Heimdallarchaeota archaeon]
MRLPEGFPFTSRYRILKRRLHPITKEFGLTLYVLRKSTLAVVGALLVSLFLFLAAFGPRIAPYDPYEVKLQERFISPSKEHWFGTDKMGRDVLSRMLHGAGYSIRAGLIVLVIAVPVGIILGGIAGLFGGWRDEVIMRITDVFLAFPSLILAMSFSAALGPSLFNAMIALSIVWWPMYTRLIRGQALSVRETSYVEAARSRGAGNWYLVRRHILPNCLSPILVTFTLDMGWIITATAALSFLGFGAQPPIPEWGRMVSDGRIYLMQAWWVSVFPGMAIAMTVLGYNLLGDGIRDALDPKLRRLTEVKWKRARTSSSSTGL